MSSNNQPSAESVIGIMAFMAFAVAIYFLLILAFILILLACIVLTVLALWAWNKPRTLFGETCTPDEAQWFVLRGICGAFLFCIVGLLFCTFTGTSMEDEALGVIAVLGYAAGSIWIEMKMEQARQNAPNIEVLPPANYPPPLPPAPPQPFDFATWEDRAER